MAETTTAAPGDRRMLRLIAVFKLGKVVLCVAGAVALLRLLAPGAPERLDDWIARLPLAPERRLGQHILDAFVTRGPGRIRLAAGVALGYAALFSTEGIGLWLGKHWAEYLTVVVTGTGIPFEIYEISRRPTLLSVGSLILNLLVVGYLVWRIRRDRQKSSSAVGKSPESEVESPVTRDP
ncbi:MAG: DUF2127 domain-containing protein [Gemmatimonadota bacterium]